MSRNNPADFCMSQFKPAIALLAVSLVIVLGWTVYHCVHGPGGSGPHIRAAGVRPAAGNAATPGTAAGAAPGTAPAAVAPGTARGTLIAVASAGNTLDSGVSPTFSRSPFFILYDPATGNTRVVNNTAPGSGIQIARDLGTMGTAGVIAGNLSPQVSVKLHQLGIKTYPGLSGTVGDALRGYAGGSLMPASLPASSNRYPPAGGTGGGAAF